MTHRDADIQVLSDSLIKEIINAVGLPNTVSLQWTFERLFHKATERLATIGVTTDRIISQSGLSKGAEWMLSNWCRSKSGSDRVLPAVIARGKILLKERCQQISGCTG